MLEPEKPETFWKASVSGTTATVAIIRNNTVHVAHVGDSRAILGVGQTSDPIVEVLTLDHEPTNPSEKRRIEESGGEVRWDNDDPFPRVFKPGCRLPALNMSRSLGDLLAKEYGVISEPEVKKIHLDPSKKFIILASDGIWEFITNEEAVAIVHKYGKHRVQEAANELAELAWNRWIEKEEDLVDDITIIVHYFK